MVTSTKLFLAAVLLGFCTGCLTTKTTKPIPVAAAPTPPPVVVSYPAGDGIAVQVTFENQQTYDAVQLGLFLMNRNSDEEMGIEGDAFFPKAFAMVNTDISDGLLYISETEASNFARAAYVGYQGEVVPAEHLKLLTKPRVIREVVAEK